jgi:starch phosphorylase
MSGLSHAIAAGSGQFLKPVEFLGFEPFGARDRRESQPIWDILLTKGDFYMHLADLTSYVQTHAAVDALDADPEAWARKAILNVACSGKFSSDRTIAEYAADIWKVQPCPIP